MSPCIALSAVACLLGAIGMMIAITARRRFNKAIAQYNEASRRLEDKLQEDLAAMGKVSETGRG